MENDILALYQFLATHIPEVNFMELITGVCIGATALRLLQFAGEKFSEHATPNWDGDNDFFKKTKPFISFLDKAASVLGVVNKKPKP